MNQTKNRLKYNTMKKLIVFTIMMIGVLGASFAQNGKLQERIKSMRIAFITEKLSLTPEEAQQFWPIFNQYEAEKKALKKSYNIPKDLNGVTDAQAEEAVLSSLDMEEKEIGLKRKYYAQLKGVLSAQKIAKLRKADREFKEKIVKIINERRRKMRRNQRQREN